MRTLKEDPEVLRNITPAAELSFALLMALARKLPAAVHHVKEGGWTREQFPGVMLRGKRLGLVGCGRIGGWMARYARAFDMDVIGHDPFLQTFPDTIRKAPLEHVFSQSDFVSIHVHLSPETTGLVSKALIDSMKPGAFLINTSRGAIVNEAALLAALESGRLGGAGLDVLEGEPDTANHPLVRYARTHDNLLITPHVRRLQSGCGACGLRPCGGENPRGFRGRAVTDIARLAEEITAHGVTRLFGVPGSGVTLSLIDALEKRGIAFHLTHFEGAGALMAATVGRLSGRAGVSLSIKGPGLANAVPGIAAAWFEAYPLVHLTEAFPPGSPVSQAHKRMDQAALVAPITKASRFSAKEGPSFTSMAHFACAEEPGPVLFELAPSAPASGEALPEDRDRAGG